jgi:xyloglucan-specific exo-beta-1,4-glucanase
VGVSVIVVNWVTSGDLWISTDMGVFHSSNFAASFSQVPGFTSAVGVALGAPKTTGEYPTVFASGFYCGVAGYFRSDDAGVNC